MAAIFEAPGVSGGGPKIPEGTNVTANQSARLALRDWKTSGDSLHQLTGFGDEQVIDPKTGEAVPYIFRGTVRQPGMAGNGGTVV